MNSFERLQAAMSGILKVPTAKISEGTRQEDLPQWDSLAHLNLMLALEQTFNVSLDVEDFDRLTSVPRIIEYLTQNGTYP